MIFKDESRELMSDIDLTQAGFCYRHLKAKWESVVVTDENKSIIDSMRVDKKFEQWYILLGTSGSGKTYLLTLLARLAVDVCRSTVFTTARELTDRIKYAPMETRLEETTKIKKCKLLIIDEVSRIASTPADMLILFDVLNFRYNANLQTAMTSNSTVAEFTKMFDDAFLRRFSEVAMTVQFDKPFGGER